MKKDVQERVVELGLTTKDRIKKKLYNLQYCHVRTIICVTALDGLRHQWRDGFLDAFWQMSIILWIQGLFDRFFIDWYWVGKTKAWEIPGTDDLKPYIPTKIMIGKWMSTILMNPLIALIIGVMQFTV